MSARIAPFLLLALSACGPDRVLEDGFFDADPLDRVTCDPTMDTFPIAGPHNIGYDHASCGTGTCAITCPDAHANSDWGGRHHGIDLFAWQGAPLVAVADGEITRVGTVSSTSGLRVRLRDACGWEYYYGHLDSAVVQPGDVVQAGDLIGYMGRTGTASTHLHFNVSPNGQYSSDIDPFPLLAATSATACDLPAEPAPAPPPAPAGCGQATADTVLVANESIASCDGRYTLVMQGDGNLVLYRTGGSWRWASWTQGNPGAIAVMQGDGNLVVYGANGAPLWHAQTHGNPGARLAVQNDGNLVIYRGSSPIWASGTHE